MKKAVPWLLRPAPMGVLGLITGFLVKMLDIHCYAQHFGVSLSDIFSQAGVWVVIGGTTAPPWPTYSCSAQGCC